MSFDSQDQDNYIEKDDTLKDLEEEIFGEGQDFLAENDGYGGDEFLYSSDILLNNEAVSEFATNNQLSADDAQLVVDTLGDGLYPHSFETDSHTLDCIYQEFFNDQKFSHVVEEIYNIPDEIIAEAMVSAVLIESVEAPELNSEAEQEAGDVDEPSGLTEAPELTKADDLDRLLSDEGGAVDDDEVFTISLSEIMKWVRS